MSLNTLTGKIAVNVQADVSKTVSGFQNAIAGSINISAGPSAATGDDHYKPKYWDSDVHREEHRQIKTSGHIPASWLKGQGPYDQDWLFQTAPHPEADQHPMRGASPHPEARKSKPWDKAREEWLSRRKVARERIDPHSGQGQEHFDPRKPKDGEDQHKAIGGEIQQRLGTPGRDNEPVMAEPGEFVVRRDQAQKPENKSILKAINEGQDAAPDPASPGAASAVVRHEHGADADEPQHKTHQAAGSGQQPAGETQHAAGSGQHAAGSWQQAAASGTQPGQPQQGLFGGVLRDVVSMGAGALGSRFGGPIVGSITQKLADKFMGGLASGGSQQPAGSTQQAAGAAAATATAGKGAATGSAASPATSAADPLKEAAQQLKEAARMLHQASGRETPAGSALSNKQWVKDQHGVSTLIKREKPTVLEKVPEVTAAKEESNAPKDRTDLPGSLNRIFRSGGITDLFNGLFGGGAQAGASAGEAAGAAGAGGGGGAAGAAGAEAAGGGAGAAAGGGAGAAAAAGPIGLAVLGGVLATNQLKEQFDTLQEKVKLVAKALVELTLRALNPAAQLGQALGPFIQQIEKFNPGAVSRLQFALDNLSAAAGRMFEPIASAVEGFANELNVLCTEIAPEARAFFSEAMVPLRDIGRELARGAQSLFREIIDIGREAIPVFQAIVPVVRTLGRELFEFGANVLRGLWIAAEPLVPLFTSLASATQDLVATMVASVNTLVELFAALRSGRLGQLKPGSVGRRLGFNLNEQLASMRRPAAPIQGDQTFSAQPARSALDGPWR